MWPSNLRQSISGYAVRWALKLPVAPPNLPLTVVASSMASCFAQSSSRTRVSFPRRVGDAGWPWVLASIGRSAHSSARCPQDVPMSSTSMGRYASAMASLTDMGTDVLLISCEGKAEVDKLFCRR